MNSRCIMAPLGASHIAVNDREKDDFYATHPSAIDHLLTVEKFNARILEPACGMGHLSKRLIEHGYDVTSYDLRDRGYGETKDFFSIPAWEGDIITNPPYKHAPEFIRHALEIVESGAKVAMFLKILFLESKGRQQMFRELPPIRIYVSSSRIPCALNGVFTGKSSATCYAWYVWEQGYSGLPTIDWIN